VAGGLLLALCCASLANAAADNEDMLDTARYAECVSATAQPTTTPADRPATAEHRPGPCRAHGHDHDETAPTGNG
jgi:hypothetical protein